MPTLQEQMLNYERIPRLNETQNEESAPSMKGVKKRTTIVYWMMSALAALPSLLQVLFGVPVPGKLSACLLGLLVPGGGFLATGNFFLIAVGIAVGFLCIKVGFMRMSVGDKSWTVAIWAAGLLGGLAAPTRLPFYSPFVVIAAAALLWGWFVRKDRLYYRSLHQQRTRREAELEDAVRELDEAVERSKALTEYFSDEMDEEALRAARTLFDITTNPIGDYSALTAPKWTMNEFRYQLCYTGYSLLLMQNRFTPNFKGYLDHSMRYLIEGFTTPQSCAYWKTLAVGGHGSLDLDPISPRMHDNIMLKGWIAPVLMGYRANMGGTAFTEKECLRFDPYYGKGPHKTYNYDEGSLAQVMYNDFEYWDKRLFMSIPCEPHLTFTVCNVLPMIGLIMHARSTGSHYAETLYERFIHVLQQDMCEVNGDSTVRKNVLLGLNWVPDMNFPRGVPMQMMLTSLLHAVYPGLARRHYAIMRHESFVIDENGAASIKGIDWNKMGENSAGMSSVLVLLAMAQLTALEFGDYEMAAALKKSEATALRVSKNPNKLEVQDGSMFALAQFCGTRWARQNGWRELTWNGQPKDGPILAECRYPDVLVARAASTNGADLALVLYNGTEAAMQRLAFEALAPGGAYRVEQTGETFTADTSGKAMLNVMVDGRTPLHIVPCKA